MKKAILISIRPEWVAKILNGDKTIEIRKTAPKCELPIDVYVYCTKDGKRPIYLPWEFLVHDENGAFVADCDFKKGNGKVVAKFTLEKVSWFDDGVTPMSIVKPSCLSATEIHDYTKGRPFYGWHISDLEIFDEPKELRDFGLKRAPQSWQFVEA